MKNKLYSFTIYFFIFLAVTFSGCSLTGNLAENNNYNAAADTVKAQKYDMGKMWTFEKAPSDYFSKEYSFDADSEWFLKARMSALKFGNGCSASFVSGDGLIMTNHHCVQGIINKAATGEEDFLRDGFIAKNINDERQIPGLFVQQLVKAEDVSVEILKEMDKGKTNEEKVLLRNKKQKEIIDGKAELNDSLIYSIISLYNGRKYSLYGYKKYTDIRIVFTPDIKTSQFGGDFDNFTYPRHDLDCAFLRVYENGKPVKSPFYFKWNPEGPKESEPVFVIGNPGRTERLKTIAQIKYDRDVRYPAYVKLIHEVYDIYFDQVQELQKAGKEDFNLLEDLFSIGNGLKVYTGILDGLNNPAIIMRKADFENNFKTAVNNDPSLKEKYSEVWDEIEQTINESDKYTSEFFTYTLSPSLSSEYFNIAKKIVGVADQMSLPEEKRIKGYTKEELDSTIENIFPANFNAAMQKKILSSQIKYYYTRLGEDNPVMKDFLGGRKGTEAVEYLFKNCRIMNKESVVLLAKETPDQIFKSDDPFIRFVLLSRQRNSILKEEYAPLESRDAINKQKLAEALFAVYGETIPPDATGTLRIADGVIKSYQYNGTITPMHTTFYGVLDKYYSFNKKFPFDLPSLWDHVPAEFDLSAPVNFISTNDIIGGNSGSPVVNKNLEVVGLAFDGNIESLPGTYIYTTESNRTVSVHSKGMIEAISHLYQLTRLSDELLTGKIIPDKTSGN